MISTADYTKEDLRTALKKLFSCLEFDQLIWGIPDHYDLCMDADEEEVVNVVADHYTEKLYPAILDAFDEHIPYMKGHDADGREFFDHTFLYHPAVQIFYGIAEAVYSGVTELMFSSEIYLLTNGDLAIVENVDVKSGDFRMEYRRQTGVIEKADDFEFDEDILFETLDAIAEGKMEEL